MVGGITEAVTRVFFSWNSELFTPFEALPSQADVPRAVQRDASTVLLTTEHQRGWCKAPTCAKVDPPRSVVHHHFRGAPVFHGGGLLPAGVDNSTLVAVRSVYKPSGTHWGIRRLTPKELLETYGLPSLVVESLLESSFSAWSSLQPVESLATAFSCYWRVMDSPYYGGGFSSHSPPAKRPRLAGVMGQGKLLEPKQPQLGNLQSLEYESEKAERELEAGTMDERERKATKADDAEVPIHLWTEQLIRTSQGRWNEEHQGRIEGALEVLRAKLFIRRWRRNVFRSFTKWSKGEHAAGFRHALDISEHSEHHFVTWDAQTAAYRWAGSTVWQWSRFLRNDIPIGLQSYATWHVCRMGYARADLDSGRDAIRRSAEASWWEWLEGSRPFHWRWPRFYQRVIRDGLPVHFLDKAPLYTVPQSDTKDPMMKEKMRAKLRKARDRGYIGKWPVKSLTTYFSVQKGPTDIRMVYDGTKSGLNDATWVPGFWLPTILTFLRMVTYGSWMSDLDVGEMFLNFVLHPSLRTFCGLDLTHYFPQEIPQGAHNLVEAWMRTGMGFKWSPYQAVQGMMVLDEAIGGDRHDQDNAFRWNSVNMNLPGSSNYDPTLAWVSKVRKDGSVATDRVIFVDDVRTVGQDRDDCWQGTRRVGSQCTYHGVQDASRKRRMVSQHPGAWAGSVVWTSEDKVEILVSEDKWKKTKSIVEELDEMMATDPLRLSRQRLEEMRGFLIYVSRTYRGLTPYLNGLHLTIDGWRDNRDEHGWRKRKYTRPERVTGGKHEEANNYRGPVTVKAATRLASDIAAMKQLVAPKLPPLRPVRSTKAVVVVYGFGDASGPGYGFCSQRADLDEIAYEFGQWPCAVSSEESSNYRELNNLVEGIDGMGRDGELSGAELFVATDNTTAEAAHSKGYSSSPKLDALILRLHLLEMKHSFTLHLFHVSGERMIDQGTDGLSRGDKSTGSMQGQPISDFLPLHLNAFERSPELKQWCLDITSELAPQVLTPEGWFSDAHATGNFIWAPPPAAADVVVEQLSVARHKRAESFHMVVVPRLFTGYWRKHLSRATDFNFELTNPELWNLKGQFEPVLIFVCLPLVTHRPKFGERTKLLARFERLVLAERLPKIHQARGRSSLRKLFAETRLLLSV